MSFSDFFLAVHGVRPFPWQDRAAALLVSKELTEVGVPTSAGKSALIDAAVWAAAHGGRRRICFVIDRRVVVDAAYDRACRIRDAMISPSSEIPQTVRDLGEPQIVRLRGGVHGDDDWVLHPERLSILLTTVDQAGSRLLFRGYGVSPRRWPMHAGFVGNDTLYIVNEAHLSEPFVQTLRVAKAQGADIDIVTMSATLTAGSTALALSEADRTNPVLIRRLRASKRATLVTVPKLDDKVFVTQAFALAKETNARRIAVIVNRVNLARRIHQALAKAGQNSALLTGRVRPIDRDKALSRILPLCASGRQRAPDNELLFVVTTQTIEVGADLDFDGLVTETASLPALRQRFGRLDRLGQLGATQAFIVGLSNPDPEDPVYGDGIATAWLWLGAVAHNDVVDFGIEAMEANFACQAPPQTASRTGPLLLPAHIHLLTQTGPMAPWVNVSPWLHGASTRATDATLVWRDDLLPGADASDWKTCARLMPPRSREGLSMPISAVRNWLAGKRVEDVSDIDAVADDKPVESNRSVLRWRGSDDVEVIPATLIRPGDTLLLPSLYGGCDEWGWAPASTAPVEDCAEACVFGDEAITGRVAIRLTQGRERLFGAHAEAVREAVEQWRDARTQLADGEEDAPEVVEAAESDLEGVLRATGHPWIRAFGPTLIFDEHPDGVVVRGRVSEEIAGVLEVGVAVSLEQHHVDVERWAQHLSGSSRYRETLGQAAAVHDEGKREERMQILLHGNPVKAALGPVLAKSGARRLGQRIAAYQASGLPRGFRHEFASLDFAKIDDPLVRYLVATHHGYGRPWAPQCADPNAPGAQYGTLMGHWGVEFDNANATHGPWRLAGMECLLRAADARASIEEAGGEEMGVSS